MYGHASGGGVCSAAPAETANEPFIEVAVVCGLAVVILAEDSFVAFIAADASVVVAGVVVVVFIVIVVGSNDILSAAVASISVNQIISKVLTTRSIGVRRTCIVSCPQNETVSL